MNNSEKYHFKDFTRRNYVKLLKLAQKEYSFIPFGTGKVKGKTIYLRHDVDFSVNSAYELAKIEYRNKIKSTFFILPHSDFYNVLEPEITSLIKKILNYGHELGLHFDSQYYVIKNVKELESKLKTEKEFFEKIFSIKIKVFSFHNPNRFALNCREYKYAGMINTYSTFFSKKVTYISDSNGYWRHKRLEDVLKSIENNSIQILLHPEWWQKKVMSPKERVWRCIDGRAAKTKKKYLTVLKKFRRNHIDW